MLFRSNIIDVLTNEDTDSVQRISPVQFIRDRELGIRGTNERFVTQGIRIDEDPPWEWSYHARRRIYKQYLNESKSEEDGVMRFSSQIEEAKYYATPIHLKVGYTTVGTGYNTAVCIKIAINRQQCVELVIINNWCIPFPAWRYPNQERLYQQMCEPEGRTR